METMLIDVESLNCGWHGSIDVAEDEEVESRCCNRCCVKSLKELDVRPKERFFGPRAPSEDVKENEEKCSDSPLTENVEALRAHISANIHRVRRLIDRLDC